MTRALLLLLLLFAATPAAGLELGGYLAVEGRLFPNAAASPGQGRNTGLSLVAQPEWYWQRGPWRAGIVAFGRAGDPDPERDHLDLRQAYLAWQGRTVAVTAGIDRVFWGATEFVHLVDLINQTDLVEDVDSEDRLGQPMVHLTVERDWGATTLYLLPWFRERRFAGNVGRPRSPLPITGHSGYESADGRDHLDLALRFSRTVGDVDLGCNLFSGTGREPELRPWPSPLAPLALEPYYPQIREISFDLQGVAGDWLWKAEGSYRHSDTGHRAAATGGVEYTFYGVGGTATDLGLLLEYAWDERPRSAAMVEDGMVMPGLRLAANDPAATSLLAGLGLRPGDGAWFLRLEGERRLAGHLLVRLEANLFAAPGPAGSSPLAAIARDDFLRLQLRWYF